jgi:pyruvate/2-oxoglutarate/acetoin dehydrogenase E1 component
MVLIRTFEDAVQRLFMHNEIQGTTHLYQGQEAVAVGVCAELSPRDVVAATYRGHGVCLAMGTDPTALMAELLGRRTGVCGSRAGTMNVIDLEHGIIGCFGIVGGSIGATTGAALASQLSGMASAEVDGNDLWAVREAAREAVARAREGGGPTLIEALTYRHKGHSRLDTGTRYRPAEEVEAWLARDPIPRVAERLAPGSRETGARRRGANPAGGRRGDRSGGGGGSCCPLAGSGARAQGERHEGASPVKGLSYREAVTVAPAAEMEHDPTVVLIGEDIALGGVFNATPGLAERFGSDRVIDTPISEMAFTAAAFGAAVRGLRPVVEIMFGDFLGLVVDTLVNQAAKYWYLSNGRASVPLTIRTAVGGGRFGACHSQTPTGFLLGEPGLKLVAPSSPADAYALIRAAIRDDNPVVVFEHKFLYGRRGPVDETAPVERIGRAATLRQGRDVTLVAAMACVEKALAAAEHLATVGIEAEVIDLRSLRPLDAETVARSAARTGRLVVVEDGPPLGGYAAEVAAIAAEAGPARVRRLTTPDLPLPASARLEDAVLTSAEGIVEAARQLAGEAVGVG